MQEIWKQLEGYNGIYFVSNKGRLKREEVYIEDSIGRVMKRPQVITFGSIHGNLNKSNTKYYRFTLSEFNKRKFILAHRLVAEYFIPNPLGKQFINHIDGDGTNNKVENLEWCTNSENVRHSHTLPNRKKMIKGFQHNNTKLSDNEVLIIRDLLDKGEMYQKDIARIFGIARTTVSGIKFRKLYKHVD